MDLIEGIKTGDLIKYDTTFRVLWEMDLIEGIKTLTSASINDADVIVRLWEMDLIEGIKTKRGVLQLREGLWELWEMDLIEGIKTRLKIGHILFVKARYEKWTW